MNAFERYFQKNESLLLSDFSEDISLIVIIPVFDDFDIFKTIDSLVRCQCENWRIGVLILVNHSDACSFEIKKRNKELAEDISAYLGGRIYSNLFFQLAEAYDLPLKHAGVGLARKMAMDCAARYFYCADNPDGVIASLDADTLVEKNYFTQLLSYFQQHPVAGVSVAYRHILEAEDLNAGQREAIQKYESYLRYYRLCLKYLQHPYAYTCLGSAFAVRARDYVAQGGMNKKQAGEDFYFIQKLVATGHFAHLNSTTVYPSARISERTPFGTGRMIKQIEEEQGVFLTYNFAAFCCLKPFFDQVDDLYRIECDQIKYFENRQAECLSVFLKSIDFAKIVEEVNSNCASLRQFRKRFYDNFNAFRVLKYLNYAHTEYYPKQKIEIAVADLLSVIAQGRDVPADSAHQLVVLRELDV